MLRGLTFHRRHTALHSWHALPARLQWTLLLATAAAGLVAAVLGGVVAKGAEVRLLELQRLTGKAPVHAPAPAPAPDFARALGATLDSEQLLSLVQQSTRRTGVVVQAASFRRHEASPVVLGRLELALELSGGYAETKQVLAELLDRVPQMTLQRLRMVPSADGSSGGALQTSALLIAWSAPLGAPLAAR